MLNSCWACVGQQGAATCSAQSCEALTWLGGRGRRQEAREVSLGCSGGGEHLGAAPASLQRGSSPCQPQQRSCCCLGKPLLGPCPSGGPAVLCQHPRGELWAGEVSGLWCHRAGGFVVAATTTGFVCRLTELELWLPLLWRGGGLGLGFWVLSVCNHILVVL